MNVMMVHVLMVYVKQLLHHHCHYHHHQLVILFTIPQAIHHLQPCRHYHQAVVMKLKILVIVPMD
jgi:hypothetical protein